MESADDGLQRVSKILARRGICSRREAERLIAAGQVTVDGEVVREQGTRARWDASIEVAQEASRELAARITVALHKPAGYVSAAPEPGQLAACDLLTADRAFAGVDADGVRRVVAAAGRLAVAGRLDRASRGLLILTEEGVLARALVGGHGVVKSYQVVVSSDVADSQIARLNRPMCLDERRLLPMRVRRSGVRALHFQLVEGMKHQIRRCCRHVGLEVVDLLRDAVGPVRLDALPEGRWRTLSPAELEALRASVVSSSR